VFDDIRDGILAQPHLAPDQAIASSLCDKCHDFRRQSVGFWSLAWLAAEALAACLRRRDAGADAPLDQFALELCNMRCTHIADDAMSAVMRSRSLGPERTAA
jgi:hypothetical protein